MNKSAIHLLNAGDSMELHMENEKGQLHTFSSTIEAILSEGRMVIQVPAGIKSVPRGLLSPEVRMVVRKNSAGLLEMFGRVVQFNVQSSGSNIIIEILSDVRQTQRRQFYRLPLIKDVRLAYNNRQDYLAVAHDISAGGLRCVLPHGFKPGDQLKIHLELNSEEHYLKGTVLDCEPLKTASPRSLIRIQFMDLTENERKCIMNYVFKEQTKRKRYLDH